MYSHLMVPVDESTLSSVNADAAVRLAQRLGARITFFHATADLAATRDGAWLKSHDPQTFAESAFGDTHAVLSRYAAGAEAAGVRCDTQSKTSNRPAEAIIDAARSSGCDLIVMATHGARGLTSWLFSSQTERVLRASPMAVLVTRVASNDPLKASDQALAVLHDEHQSIAAVTAAMRDLVVQAPATGAGLDLLSLEAMLDYLQAFVLQIHYPKEEHFLHRALRERAPECEDLLRSIEAQHDRRRALINETVARLQSVMSEQGASSDSLFDSVLALADGVPQNIALEERSVWPLARKRLHEEDWVELATAFHSHFTPGYGELQVTEVRRLFMRIAKLRSSAAG